VIRAFAGQSTDQPFLELLENLRIHDDHTASYAKDLSALAEAHLSEAQWSLLMELLAKRPGGPGVPDTQTSPEIEVSSP
jgi:hypothetical protein